MSDSNSAVPPPGVITNPPGAKFIHYRVGDFASFRTALLTPLGDETELVAWRPMAEGDLAVQLVEWWAYLADILTFYNEQIANESYFATASRAALLQLTNLVGYRPSPPTASVGKVAALLSSATPLTLPAGFALQSKAGPGESPQVFETVDPVTFAPSPTGGALAVDATPETSPIHEQKELLLDAPLSGVSVGDFVLVVPNEDILNPVPRLKAIEKSKEKGAEALSPPAAQALRITKLSTEKDPLGRMRYRVGLSRAVRFKGDVSDHSILKTTSFAVPDALQVRPEALVRAQGIAAAGTQTICLAAPLRTLSVGDLVVVENAAGALHPLTVTMYREVWDVTLRDASVAEELEHGALAVVERSATPATTTPQQPSVLVALIRVAGAPAKDEAKTMERRVESEPAVTKIWHGFRPAPSGLVGESPATIPAGAITLKPLVQVSPGGGPILVEGADQLGISVQSTAMVKDRIGLTVPDGASLAAPIRLLSNVITVSQGRTVPNEVLGSGDATAIGQTFSLKKGPLTYLVGPVAGSPPASTLAVFVNGMQWKEAPNFYARGPQEAIYVVHHDVDLGTAVQFGDGVRGARLPTGRGNVTATYRYGSAGTPGVASVALPPTKLVTILTPQPGIKSIRNPVAIQPGCPAPADATIRSEAPASVQHLDRAVTAADYEAIAIGAGAHWARATIHWDRHSRVSAPIVYIDDAEFLSAASDALTTASPHSGVRAKVGVPVKLSIDVHLVVFPGHDPECVKKTVKALLTEGAGVLTASHVHLNRPPDAGQIRAACRDVDGVIAVSVKVGEDSSARRPDAFFPVSPSEVHIRAEVDRHG